MLQKTKTFIFSHKIISIIVIIIIVVCAYFFIFKKNTSGETQYVTQTVGKGSIITTVAGTGQIGASNTITLSPQTSGTINHVGVSVGQSVKKGTLIASVDSSDAKMALVNAQIALDNLTKGPDALTLLQKQNGLADSYVSGWNTVSSYINDMTVIVNSINTIYSTGGYLSYENTMKLSTVGKNEITSGQSGYYAAKDSIDKLTALYKSLTSSSSQQQINDLINQAYASSLVVSSAIKSTQAAFNFVVNELNYGNDTNAVTTDRANINSWLSSSNGYINSLLSATNAIKENTQSLQDTATSVTSLDVQVAQLALQSKQDAYNGCFVYAPFDGVIATLTAQVGQPSGSSIGTIITQQELATVSLNEIDIAKIKLGQKATLTFAAVDGLSITGHVAEIDSVGAVSQGVVSYNIQISLDVNDARVKPGMSVSATIITDSAQDVIVIPSSAIKTQNGASYVQTFSSPLLPAVAGAQGSPSTVLPTQTDVVTGLIGDTSTEITSGLNVGDIIVTKTITNATPSAARSTTPSLLNAVGGGGGAGRGVGGAAFRAAGGN